MGGAAFRPREIGSRYETLTKLAAGGMATVYAGRQRGAQGFSRLVAIKRPHPALLLDPDFKAEVISEAHVASRLHHPNVVGVLDVEEVDGDPLLILEYVHGVTLAELLAAASLSGAPLDVSLTVRIVLDAARGLEAAHALVDDAGVPLELVHRDVTPQNILVGVDGVGRLTDFGIAHSKHSPGHTLPSSRKGKVGYMAPEYRAGGEVTQRIDVYSLGVVLWEALVGRRLGAVVEDGDAPRSEPAPRVAVLRPDVVASLSEVVERATSSDAERRFSSGRELRKAIESAAPRIATHDEVSEAVTRLCADAIDARQERVSHAIRASGEITDAGLTGVRSPVDPDVDSGVSASTAVIAATRSGPVKVAAPPPPSSRTPRTTLSDLETGARWALLAGVGGILTCMALVLPALAIVLGHVTLRRARRSRLVAPLKAVAGLALGYIGFFVGVALIVIGFSRSRAEAARRTRLEEVAATVVTQETLTPTDACVLVSLYIERQKTPKVSSDALDCADALLHRQGDVVRFENFRSSEGSSAAPLVACLTRRGVWTVTEVSKNARCSD